MNGLTDQIILILIGGTLMLVFLGLGAAVIMPGIDRWSKRFFIVFFIILVLYACFTMVDGIIYGRPDWIAALKTVYYFETLLAMILMPMITAYLLHCCGESFRRSAFFFVVAALWFAAFLMLNVSLFTT